MESVAAGGAGGKFRKRASRRAATPYDRPVNALRNPSEERRNGWFSKIVDPASRIIAKTAERFFSSVSRKSLPAPQTVSETNHEPRDNSPQTVSANFSSGAQEHVNNEGDNQNNHPERNGIIDLEQILKHKTFTRAEIDRLTELLRKRSVDTLVEDDNGRSEPSTPSVATEERQNLAIIPMQEIGMEKQKLLGDISDLAVSSIVLEKHVASPAELAKAYMGSRPSKTSLSSLGLRSPALRKDADFQSNTPFPPTAPKTIPAPRTSVHFPGVSENGYLTPRPRGRSAIYSMARTPNSRLHPSSSLKGVGSRIDGYPSSSTSFQFTQGNNTLSTGKQVLKRRSSVLDSESVGPIRITRLKTNLISPGKDSTSQFPRSPISPPGTAVFPDATQGSMSAIKRPLLLLEPKHKTSGLRLSENKDNNIGSTSFTSVPSQSSQMAQKILMQLDKLVPSPKEKSSELKLAPGREKSPTKFTHSIFHGQPIRSLVNTDSSNLPHTVQGTGNSCDPFLTGPQQCTSIMQSSVLEDGPIKVSDSEDKVTPEANGVETTGLIKNTMCSTKIADSSISKANSSQKKRAFQMSAHEDSLELEGDSHCIKSAHKLSGAETVNLGSSAVERNKVTVSETVASEKPPVSSSENNASASFVFYKDNNVSTSYGGMFAAEKNPSFTFPVTSVSYNTTQLPPLTPQSPLLFNGVFPSKEVISASVFDVGIQGVDKAPSISFSPSSSGVIESSSLKFGTRSDSEQVTLNSPASVAVMTTGAISKTESRISDKDNLQKAGDLFRKPENTSSLGCSASSNSSLKNGSISSTSSIFPIPNNPSVPVSSSFKDQIFSGSPTDTTPSLPVAPVFTFGSSIFRPETPPTSISPPTTSGAESTDLVPNTKRPSPFGSPTSSPLGGNIFGFGASVPSTTMNPSSSSNNQFQSSGAFSSAPGFSFGGTPFAQNMPNQFSSSASNNSPFGSSTSGAKPFGASSSSGANLFGSSLERATSSTFGSSFGSSSSAATGFSFGGSSSIGASSGPIFSFTSASSAAATTAPLQPVIGTTNPISFGSSASLNNDQMNMEDSMAEDTIQAPTSISAPVLPTFGQPGTTSTPPCFMFGSPSPSGAPFQFGNQQNPVTPQIASPFQATGGSFSLGSGGGGGGDKSTRRIVKINKNKSRKK